MFLILPQKERIWLALDWFEIRYHVSKVKEGRELKRIKTKFILNLFQALKIQERHVWSWTIIKYGLDHKYRWTIDVRIYVNKLTCSSLAQQVSKPECDCLILSAASQASSCLMRLSQFLHIVQESKEQKVTSWISRQSSEKISTDGIKPMAVTTRDIQSVIGYIYPSPTDIYKLFLNDAKKHLGCTGKNCVVETQRKWRCNNLWSEI